MRKTYLSSLLLAVVAAGLALLSAADTPPRYEPKVAPASDEPARAAQKIRVPQELKLDLFAAEPHLANIVAFAIDEKNRFYTAETYRLHDGVTDIRGHMNWLDDDLACRTVEDRVAMYRKHLRDKFSTYEKHHDLVRLVEDTDGDGKADRSRVFADGFSDAAAGIGSGLYARRGQVWYTCIPGLWLLEDPDNKGVATRRKKLHHGYGVHVGFLGHDLHGLTMGPDGKLYFSIGDRGLNVKTADAHLHSPDTGAVIRCNPDGSETELFAVGLRNPQELAFDKYGNLFTGDNNSDGGDKARWVYLVEGGDSGWRIGYQFLNTPVARGPWNNEKMWHPHWEGQPAHLVPPIANLADGPSGLAYYPGVGLPERYNEHFFLADFRGGSGGSGVRSFANKPRGAWFELTDSQQFVWNVLATDVDFGMDGAMYISDWTEGWGKPSKGRIWKVTDPKQAKNETLAEVKRLMAEGFENRSTDQLAQLLEHPDQRVRLEAQFALAARGKDAVAPLGKVAKESKNQLARLHALWGLGQVGRKVAVANEPIAALLADGDVQVRSQAVKLTGDNKVAAGYEQLVKLLGDDEPRIRFFAAQSLGKLGKQEAVPHLLALLKQNADSDPYLRHACVLSLARLDDRKALEAASKDENPSVRLGVLLALRRLGSPEVAKFLYDDQVRVAAEAARAINDAPVNEAMPALAATLDTVKPAAELWLRKLLEADRTDPAKQGTALLYRALNANLRLGKPENARVVAAFAARRDAPPELRVEALRILGEWGKPSGRDRVVGLWRPIEPRDATPASDAIKANLAGILNGPDAVRTEATKLTARLGIKEVGPALLGLLQDVSGSAEGRVETLRALEALKDKQLPKAVEIALADPHPRVRSEGRRLLAKQDADAGLKALRGVLDEGDRTQRAVSPEEQKMADRIARQGAFAVLGTWPDGKADAILAPWLDKLVRGQVDPELQLDLIQAAQARKNAAVKEKLARFEASRRKDDPLAAWRETLAGGDAENGRRLFLFKNEVYCLRCHKVEGQGGEVGPDLKGIGGKQTREYLLESIALPSKQIAKGFDTVLISTSKGQVIVGVVKTEDDREVRLMTAEGKLVVVPKKDIEERQTTKSAMPEDLIQKLSKSELRDLIEFLAQSR